MKELIVYFSRSGQNYVSGRIVSLTLGNTKRVAQMIQEVTNADMFEIRPVQAYPLEYHACTQVAQEEVNMQHRPEIIDQMKTFSDYDTIYLGYPNWWGTCPMAVFTFLDHQDLAGKRILPFCTHEGSGLGQSVKDLQRMYPTAIIEEGIALSGSHIDQITPSLHEWLGKVKSR